MYQISRPIFRWLGRIKLSIQAQGKCSYFVTNSLFTARSCQRFAQTPKLEDHYLSAVRDCLFNIFAATFNIGGRSSIRTQRKRHAVVICTHLARISQLTCVIITMAVWNNPPMNSQAKTNCKKKSLLLHTLLTSAMYLQCIKKKQWLMMGIINMMIFFMCALRIL